MIDRPITACTLFALLLACLAGSPLVRAEEPDRPRADRTFKKVDPDDPPEVLSRIQSRMRRVSHFRAEFTETKKLEALSREIQNRGFVLFDRKRGLYRQVEHPFKTRQLITEDGLVIEKSRESTRRKKLNSDSAPGRFLDSLYLVFSGDFSKFHDRFHVAFSVASNDEKKTSGETSGNEHWFLRLRPAGEKMKKILSEMVIEGRGIHLKSFTLYRRNGDTTRTTFQNPTYSDELTDEQRDRFRSMTSAK